MARNYPVWFMENDSHMYLDSGSRTVHDGHGHDLYRYADRKLIALSGNGSMDVQTDGRIVDSTGIQIGFITDFPLFTMEIRNSGTAGGTGTKTTQSAGRTGGTSAGKTAGNTAGNTKGNTAGKATGSTGRSTSGSSGTSAGRTTGKATGSAGTSGAGGSRTTGTPKPEKKKSHAWLVVLIIIGIIYLVSQNSGPKETIYKNVDEAALELRKAILNFDDEITLKYKVRTKQDSFFRQEAVDLYQKAVAHTGNPNEGDWLTTQCFVKKHHGDYKEDGSGYIATATLELEYYTTKEQEQQLQSKIRSIISELNLTGKSDYQKVRAIYKWICSHVTYDHARLNDKSYIRKYTAYNAAMTGNAVCAGYAALFYRLALSAGLQVRINNSLDHSWNLVRMDGLYYHCDTTWDAGKPESQYKYLLCGNWTLHDHYTYESNICYNPFADHLSFIDIHLPTSNTDYKP